MSLQALSQSLAAKGRGGDSMLVHMAPSEVAGLQALAEAHGTSLSINPETGMPEAFKLKDLIPYVAAYFMGPAGLGMSAGATALTVGGLTAAATGDITKGLMAGLGSYGMANFGGSLANLATPNPATPATAIPQGVAAGATAPVRDAVLAQGASAVPGLTAAPAGVTVSPVGPTAPVQPPLKLDALTAEGFTDLSQSGLSGSAGDTGMSAAKPAPGGLPSLVTPATPGATPATLSNMMSGAENLMKSGDAGKFLWNQKGNLLMAAAPLLATAEPEYEEPKDKESQIRPFELAIDNRSGEYAPYAPGDSSERQMISYNFIPQEPYAASEAYKRRNPFMAAQGGSVKRYEDGGEVASDAETTEAPLTVGEIPITPGAVDTVRNISMVQGLAGLPALDVSQLPVRAPGQPQLGGMVPRPLPFTRSPIQVPVSSGTNVAEKQKLSDAELRELLGYRKSSKGGIFGGKGGSPSIVGYTQFGEPIYGVNSNDGGKGGLSLFSSLGKTSSKTPTVQNYSYDPVTQTYTRMAAGGDTSRYTKGLESLMAKGGAAKKRNLAGDPYYKFSKNRQNKSMESAIEENFAAGGANLNDGDFVFDARTVSEIGNGSTEAGQKILAARFNARPVRGPGDGVSDSIRANIGGVQKARIANGEAVVPAPEVKRAGGAKKLYALMDKAHNARKKAGRGADTKIGKQLLA